MVGLVQGAGRFGKGWERVGKLGVNMCRGWFKELYGWVRSPKGRGVHGVGWC